MEDQKTKKARHGEVDGEVDRLSDLHDCVLLHILSFVDTLDAVKTCILSKRWRHLWKDVPTLILCCSNFWGIRSFRKFVSEVMSGHNGTIGLCNLNFVCYRGSGRVQIQFLDSVINDAVSHNVQELTLCVYNDSYCPAASMFSCLSLTSLTVQGRYADILLPRSLDLTALTNLHLGYHVKFSADDNGRADPFGNCIKLNTLIIGDFNFQIKKDFATTVSGTLRIANDTLTNLSIGNSYRHDHAPKIELCTPNLRSFTVFQCKRWSQMSQFSGHKFDFLEEAHIDITARDIALLASSGIRRNALIFMDMLQLLSNVKSMTISSSVLKVLSYASLETQPPYFSNLKSLKVIAFGDIPDGILDYLLQNSSVTEVTVVD